MDLPCSEPLYTSRRFQTHRPHKWPNSFGIHGSVSLFGGNRGRTLLITGILYGEDIPALNVAESVLESYADGRIHTIVDDRGRAYFNMIYHNEYQPDAEGPKTCHTIPGLLDGCWVIPYRMTWRGLT